MREPQGKILRKTRDGTYSAAQVHAMIRQAMVLMPSNFRTPISDTGLTSEPNHFRAHVDTGALFPVHTRTASSAALALAAAATSHLRIDQDRPL